MLFQLLAAKGVEASIVWNKSNREQCDNRHTGPATRGKPPMPLSPLPALRDNIAWTPTILVFKMSTSYTLVRFLHDRRR